MIFQRSLLVATSLLLLLAGVVHAQESSPLRAIDPDGSLTEAELMDYVQLHLMADPRPPLPAAQGAVSAAIGQLGFSLVTGGSGSRQDIARPRYDSVRPDTH